MHNRMFLNLAVADAYGAGMEYVPLDFTMTHNTLEYMVKHPSHGLEAGQYTDDTQMTIGLVEYLLNAKKLDRKELVSHWIKAFQRDKRLGYARRFQEFLETHTDADSFLKDIIPYSDKSGGAMRVTPIGLIPDTKAVIELADWQASITHDTVDGRESAVAAALLTHFCTYVMNPNNMNPGTWINAMIPNRSTDWNYIWNGKIGTEGKKSVLAAITAVRQNRSLSEILRTCVAFTGDVDTAATIAIGAASNSDMIDQNLPESLVNQLEPDSPYGRYYLLGLEFEFVNWIERKGWQSL